MGGVNGEGRVHGGAPLLLGQTLQEAPDLGAEEEQQSGPGGPGAGSEPGQSRVRPGSARTHAVVSFLPLMLGTSTPANKCPSMLLTPAM